MSTLPQVATIWRRSSTAPNRYGAYDFAEPESINVKWNRKQELFRNNTGEEEYSSAVVFLAWDTEISIGDYLLLGDSTAADPTTTPGAYEVRAVESVRALISAIGELKVML